MSDREATAQQVDPLGALNMRPVTVVIALFAVALAIGRTLTQVDEVMRDGFSIMSIVFVVIAAATLIVASSPLRAPLRRTRFVAVVACGVLGMLLAAVATAGHDVMVRDDWGSTVIGLLILACAPYRPGRDLLVATVVSAVAVGIVVLLEAPTFATQAPALVFVAVGVTPVVALGVGSAVYSANFVRQVGQWTDRAESLTAERASEVRSGIARSVQQDRVTGLNRDVVPFFTSLVERGEVTDADTRRAGEVATLIRERIVADADRSWLEQALLDVCPNGEAGTVVDRSRLADHMTTDQRTAVRAIVNAMSVDDATRTSSLGIVLHDDAPLVRALLRVESTSTDAAARQHFAPYFAVLRILFRDLQVDVNGSLLTLRFSYDQH